MARNSSVLSIKLWRELWHMRGQVLAVALVIGGGVAVCAMSLVNFSSLAAGRSQHYQQHQFADVFAPVKRAPKYLMPRLESIPGIRQLTLRVEALARLEVPGFADPVSATLVSLPAEGQPSVNQLFIRQGRLPVSGRGDEAVIIGSFAEAHGLSLGDALPAIINGRKQRLRIIGIAESPEFIYVVPPGGFLPDYQRYGVIWMPEPALAAAMNMRGAFNGLVATVEQGYPVASVIDALDRVLERFGAAGAFAREHQFSHRFLNDELKQLQTMATIFPLIFMSVAMFLMHVVLSRLISSQRDVIAILKAFGYTNRQLGWHYSQLVFSIAGIGLLLGLGAGLWLGRGLSELYMQYYRFPEHLFRINPTWLILLALITFLVAWLGGWRAIHRAAAMPPAEAMRPEGPSRFSMTRIESWLSGLGMTQPSRIILRQLSRRPVRVALSLAGVAMATAIIMVGNFQFDSVALMVHTQFARVQQQDLTVTFTEPVSASALFNLARQSGIRQVEGRRVVAVRLVNGHREWRTALNGWQADAKLQFVIDRDLNRVELPQKGLLLTDFLAQKLGVSVGDSLSVQVLEGRRPTVPVEVAGVTSEFLGVGAYMQLEALNRALQEGAVINQALVNIDPDAEREIYQRLRDSPRVLSVGIRQAMLDSFFDTLARTFLTFTFFNSILGGIIAFGVIYNTIRISLAEKGRELASLRVLGYTHSEVAHILLGEAALLLVVGIPLGWLAGEGLAWLIITAMQTELYRVPLVITAQTLGMSALVVAVSAILSGAMAWWRLKELDLVAVLKARE